MVSTRAIAVAQHLLDRSTLPPWHEDYLALERELGRLRVEAFRPRHSEIRLRCVAPRQGDAAG